MQVTTDDGFLTEMEGRHGSHALLLVHGSVVFEGCRPLLWQRELTGDFLVIHYYRRGYRDSPVAPPGFTIADQARDARAVLRNLGISNAHILGHSTGALIAMQLAIDSPEIVRSLVLVEPTWASRSELLEWFQRAIAPVIEAFRVGDRNTAVDRMLRLIDGDHYRQALDRVFGDDWVQAAASALDVYFNVELPAAVSWTLDVARAARITQPTLVLRGELSPAEFGLICDDAVALLRQSRGAIVSRATHNVIAVNPVGSATLIRKFVLEVDEDR